MEYDVQQVCLNGHQITAYYHLHPEDRKPIAVSAVKKPYMPAKNAKRKYKAEEYLGLMVCVILPSFLPHLFRSSAEIAEQYFHGRKGKRI